MTEHRYELYGPVRLKDGREAIFISSSWRGACCCEARVLSEGVLEIVHPDDIDGIPGAPLSLDPDWYLFRLLRTPVKGWAKYAALKAAAERYLALSLDERLAMSPRLPDHYAYPEAPA